MVKLSGLGLVAFFLFAPAANSQSTPALSTSSPQAVALASQAIAALTGTTQVNDVTLTGTGTRTVGSDVETGAVSLKALATGEGRLDLSLSASARSEIHALANGTPQCSSIGLDGVVHSMADHNCLTDPIWFFPALSMLSQASSPGVVATYVGQESTQGVSVQHIQFTLQNPNLSTSENTLLGQLSSTDIYLDASSNLPVAICFNMHPDDDALTNIPVKVVFSNYQVVNGVQVPFRIQRFLNGTLFLDLMIQATTLNSGLTNAAFSTN